MEEIVLNTKIRNKILGAIYGFVIGDAMGATTEFMNIEQIKKKYKVVKEIIGGGWLNLNPGEITDDTQMTICVMNAIMKQPKDGNEFKEFCSDNFINWINSNPKDIGGQCMKSIYRLECKEEIPIENSALGNGSLMRAMPLAILNLPYLNVVQGELTHRNRTCSGIILEYTGLIQEYLKGNYNNLYTKKVKKLQKPSGFIYNTFNNSVYWSKKNSFKKAIIGAVNHGGDADTIAAITGSLAGAKFGFNNIPTKWVEKLNPDIKQHLEQFAYFCFECLKV